MLINLIICTDYACFKYKPCWQVSMAIRHFWAQFSVTIIKLLLIRSLKRLVQFVLRKHPFSRIFSNSSTEPHPLGLEAKLRRTVDRSGVGYWWRNMADEPQGSTQDHSILELNSVLLVVLMLFTLVGNVLILLSLWKNKRLHKTTHLNSISLIIANLIPASTIIPLRVIRVWKESKGELSEETTLCEAYLTATLLWCVVSILTLAAMSMDRYIAISRPHNYAKIFTRCRAFSMLSLVWSFAIALSFLPFYHSGSALKLFNCNFNLLRKENYVYLLLAVEIIPLILMFVVHYQIMKLSAKHAQSVGVVDSRLTEYRKMPLDFPAEVRWSRVVIMIILLYVLMWVPRCIFLIVDARSLSTNNAKAFDVLTEVTTYSFAGLVPFVLVHFNSDIREEFFRITMPYQWFRRSHGVGKKYTGNKNSIFPFYTEMWSLRSNKTRTMISLNWEKIW